MTWTGSIAGFHISPRSFLPMKTVKQLELVADVGIKGDRYSNENGFYSDRPEEGRQVTLFEQETLDALKRDHSIQLLMHEHRRNITTRDVPLNHLVGRKFQIGPVVLEGTRLSTPCRHIEQITGKEIFDVLLHRSGLHARILNSGTISTSDQIELV